MDEETLNRWMEHYKGYIGQKVYKFNRKTGARRRTFKSGLQYNTVKDVIVSPFTGQLAFTFVEDDSCVDTQRLKLKDGSGKVNKYHRINSDILPPRVSSQTPYSESVNYHRSASQSSSSIKYRRRRRLLNDIEGPNFECHWCAQTFSKDDATLEHIDENFRPVNDMSNLTLACHNCNQLHSRFQDKLRRHKLVMGAVYIPPKLADRILLEGRWELTLLTDKPPHTYRADYTAPIPPFKPRIQPQKTLKEKWNLFWTTLWSYITNK